MAIIFVAAAVIATIVALDDDASSGAPAVVAPAAAEPLRLIATSNLRAGPDRLAEILAILPADSAIAARARSVDGLWIEVARADGEAAAGWVLAAAVPLDEAAVAALAVAAGNAVGPGEPVVEATPAAEALPDLVIAEAFLLADGRLAVGLRNVGDAPLIETEVPLNVSKAAGEILGVFRIGPTTLAPGSSATVVTSVVVTETGSFVLELDRPNEIRESGEFNNIFRTLLVAGGG